MRSLFIGQTIERLKAKTEKDNKSLEGLYKLFEKRLLENRDINLKVFQEQRKEAFFERFDVIITEDFTTKKFLRQVTILSLPPLQVKHFLRNFLEIVF